MASVAAVQPYAKLRARACPKKDGVPLHRGLCSRAAAGDGCEGDTDYM